MRAAAAPRRGRAGGSWGGFDKEPGASSPPPHVENSGVGSMANAMHSSSFVSLENNVMGYNWGNYGLLEEAKHRCLSPASGYASPQPPTLNSPFPDASCLT